MLRKMVYFWMNYLKEKDWVIDLKMWLNSVLMM
jgi:hypothetical protein